jgi:hypothetical protein
MWIIRKAKKRRRGRSAFRNLSPGLSLGQAAASEGKVLERKRNRDGSYTRYEIASCTCGGENENCYKCDGTGYYRKIIIEGAE